MQEMAHSKPFKQVSLDLHYYEHSMAIFALFPFLHLPPGLSTHRSPTNKSLQPPEQFSKFVSECKHSPILMASFVSLDLVRFTTPFSNPSPSFLQKSVAPLLLFQK